MKTGKVLYLCRKKANLTQYALEKKTGLNRSSIANWENGKCEPRVSDFIKLLNVMGYDLKIVKFEKRQTE